MGYEVDIAIDGRTGLEKFKNKKYDIVLTDYRMHGRNGIDIAKEMLKMDMMFSLLFLL